MKKVCKVRKNRKKNIKNGLSIIERTTTTVIIHKVLSKLWLCWVRCDGLPAGRLMGGKSKVYRSTRYVFIFSLWLKIEFCVIVKPCYNNILCFYGNTCWIEQILVLWIVLAIFENFVFWYLTIHLIDRHLLAKFKWLSLFRSSKKNTVVLSLEPEILEPLDLGYEFPFLSHKHLIAIIIDL